MKKFLTQVAEYVQASHTDGLHDTLLVFPNNRAAYFFHEEMKKIEATGHTAT